MSINELGNTFDRLHRLDADVCPSGRFEPFVRVQAARTAFFMGWDHGEQFADLCEANGYEFTESGKLA